MKTSEHGKQLLAEWEGVKTQVYQDSAELATIGVGHLLTKQERASGKIVIDGQQVEYAHGLSKAQVMALMTQDLARFEQTVNSAVTVELSQNQFDALVCFCFNIGAGAFKDSTLLKELNKGNYDAVPGQLGKWVKADGKSVAGLVNLRNKEINLWTA